METLSSRLAGLKGQQIFHAIDGEEMQSAIQLWDKFVDGRRRGMYQVFCFNHSERISPDALLQFLNVYWYSFRYIPYYDVCFYILLIIASSM
jgi:hypothetical protein